MLEVKHLKRIYKLKNAEPVYALNDVSLKFPETGLVFILGKSGSGKSTLLNVMGGLDKVDEGEIIINGKSSKEFSGSEMDSYRNTYLGFIFQEYNILSDFTVGENIGLALQLQHKKATPEAIEKILEEVDLAGYAKRKPNELSGGQKQRVAIARALVKEPKIIFGDEPTGALDSNTGKQVFETLKKLSKDKLVVIVSHDRDFAEHFGDRVIELKDGVVISDITKTSVESKKVNQGISLIGDNIIHIKHDHKLTLKDLDVINQALEKNGKDAFISIDEHVNEAVCEAARIDKSGNREEFVSTDDSKIKMGDGKFEAIKSRFSLGRAFKMGAKSLRVKPFRLAMTIILSTVAFSLFGVSATLSSFNSKKAIISTCNINDICSTTVNISEKRSDYKKPQKGLTQDRIDQIKQETGVQVYALKNDYGTTLTVPSFSDNFHLQQYRGVLDIDNQIMNDLGISIHKGNLPSKDDEVCIPLYAYYSYKDLGYGITKNDASYISPDNVSEDNIIGKYISIYQKDEMGQYSPKTCKIVGILDTKYPSKYLKYRDSSNSLTYANSDYSSVSSLRQSPCVHNIIYKFKTEEKSESISINSQYLSIKNTYTSEKGNYEQSFAINGGYFPSYTNNFYFDNTKTSLNSSEGLISLSLLNQLSIYSSGDNTSSTTITFKGAYGSPEDSENECSIQLYGNSFNYSEVKNAAVCKTTYDNYEDFYNNHLDIIKNINEGKYSNVNEGVGLIEDYSSMTNDNKYTFLMIYLNNFVANVNNYSSNNYLDKNNCYYLTDYENNYQTYLNQVYDLITFKNLGDISNIYSNYKSEYISDYSFKNALSVFEEYKDNEVFKQMFPNEDLTTQLKAQYAKQFIQNYFDIYFKADFLNDFINLLKNFDLKNCSQSLRVYLGETYTENAKLENVYFNIVGINLDSTSNLLSMTKEDATSCKQKLEAMNCNVDEYISTGFVGFGQNREKLDKFLDFYLPRREKVSNHYDSLEDGYWYLYINSNDISTVEMTASMILLLKNVFLYVGIALAAFSGLLFYNFMSISINNKKREIGILRAVGAKRADVFKIFYSEAFIISFINFILSTIITFILSYFVNKDTASSLNFNIMEPSILVVLMLFGISMLLSIVSAFLPVTKIANKKPIDAIHNR